MAKEQQFEIRDLRQKDQYITDDKFLNGYARFLGIYAVGVYSSLCRHANKEQKSWPSIKTICEELSIGRNSVIAAIKRLEFWNIISKERVGKKATNRYWLINKKEWKSVSEVCLKDYSEVCHINFSGLRDKLQRFATQTSIVRRYKEGDKEKEIAAPRAVDNIQLIFNVFYEGNNPTINFGNKTSRKAAEFLIKKFGLEKSTAMALYAVSVTGEEFAPTITTPFQLREKLASLIAYHKRKNNKKSSKIYFVI